MQQPMLTPVVNDGPCLVIIDVGVASQLVQRQAVQVQLPRSSPLDDEETLGFLWKIVDFIELIHTHVASQSTAILQDFVGEMHANARHSAQCGTVGCVQDNVLVLCNLLGINSGVNAERLVFDQSRGWQVVAGNMDVGLQLAVLLHGETVKPGKVFFPAIHASGSPVAVNVANLPRLESQTQQGSAVGSVGVEIEAFGLWGRRQVVAYVSDGCCILVGVCPSAVGCVWCRNGGLTAVYIFFKISTPLSSLTDILSNLLKYPCKSFL